MKLALIVAVLFLVGCTAQSSITSTQQLLLSEQEGITQESCTTEAYETSEYSSLAEYSFCTYTTATSEIVLEVKKFTNKKDRDGTYLYQSSHLRGYQGANEPSFNGDISDNTLGEASTFYYNNESSTYYYHFYITEEDFLIHITSKGVQADKELIEQIAKTIMNKFE